MSMLSDKEKAVIETITMRFHAPEALVYLKNKGMEMGIATYYRYRKKVESMKLERMQFIEQHFQELHLEKITMGLAFNLKNTNLFFGNIFYSSLCNFLYYLLLVIGLWLDLM